MRKLLLLVLLGISIPRSQAQTIVDTFSGNTLNESYWTIGPVSSGDWFEVDNGLTLENRAHLTTKDGVFGSPLTITGTVTFNSIEDYLTIALRFDGAYENVPYYESSSGVRVLFGPVLRNAAGNKNYVEIYDADAPASISKVDLDSFTFSTGVAYEFTVTDDGSTISLFLGNELLISGATASNSGGFVGLYSREHSGDPFPGLLLSSISISSGNTAIPEPSTWAVLVGSLTLGMAMIRRRVRSRA